MTLLEALCSCSLKIRFVCEPEFPPGCAILSMVWPAEWQRQENSAAQARPITTSEFKLRFIIEISTQVSRSDEPSMLCCPYLKEAHRGHAPGEAVDLN